MVARIFISQIFLSLNAAKQIWLITSQYQQIREDNDDRKIFECRMPTPISTLDTFYFNALESSQNASQYRTLILAKKKPAWSG